MVAVVVIDNDAPPLPFSFQATADPSEARQAGDELVVRDAQGDGGAGHAQRVCGVVPTCQPYARRQCAVIRAGARELEQRAFRTGLRDPAEQHLSRSRGSGESSADRLPASPIEQR